jgi:hypothetical protein
MVFLAFCEKRGEDLGPKARLESTLAGGAGDRKEDAVEEKQTPTTSDTEDVEGHSFVERPPAEDRDALAEDPDVEGHALVERPPVERPVAE